MNEPGLLPDAEVSAREADVLAALADHLTNAEIAERLFISVRTVESHVSSLLRKLQVRDRRALAALAVRGEPRHRLRTAAHPPSSLPIQLSSFVGRVAERAALADALTAHRLVTAVGPGGVGKTRLALSVAADVEDRFPDGVRYVDLVPVTDAAGIGPAIADAIGLGEHEGRSAEDVVTDWLAPQRLLLVLDNCEHLLGGVGVLAERLLARSAELAVLATSRSRLLVPFERVFPVPGLSVVANDAGRNDALELFLTRSAAAGRPVTNEEIGRVETLCRNLDGMALAIELAAARMPSMGLDGLEAGLADRLQLLTGGRRNNQRHQSLRSTLDWSYALLSESERAVLRRISVFAAPFTADAAAQVAAWTPGEFGDVRTTLGALADHSLLVAVPGRTGTRYRALETIRQYGRDQLRTAGESARVHGRHMHWCLGATAALGPSPAGDVQSWRAAADELVDELRAALTWAKSHTDNRVDGYRVACTLADLCFAKGAAGEAQRRYEQAAGLAGDEHSRAFALRQAAGAAQSRHFGDDALRLRRAAAESAARSGHRAAAAWDLAAASELISRRRGVMATPPPWGELAELLREAHALAAGDPAAEARVFASEAFVGDDLDPVTAELAERATELARRVGDPLIESAALDQLISVQLARGELGAAAASAYRCAELVRDLPVTPLSALEVAGAFYMAADCAVAAGDLRSARRFAERIQVLPFHRGEGHLATARLMTVTALTGDWDETVALAERFRDGWERAGRPRADNLIRGAYSAATVHGLRGDDAAREAWLEIVAALAAPTRPLSAVHIGEFLDVIWLLHRGRTDQAFAQLTTPPEYFRTWFSGMWRAWYAAVWAEVAVVTGHPDAPARLRRARLFTADNPIASAIVDRSAALMGDRAGLRQAAAALESGGARYHWARTLIMCGGVERERGEAVLAAMGATPMVWPGC
ncbi:MAG TPA: LuxR C-terminal-related transcriptional regulator [Jatrophihabitans sp.]|nr:LuxR C-terminal-related transcriptional regulator [Jatrophihabitans sp.]